MCVLHCAVIHDVLMRLNGYSVLGLVAKLKALGIPRDSHWINVVGANIRTRPTSSNSIGSRITEPARNLQFATKPERLQRDSRDIYRSRGTTAENGGRIGPVNVRGGCKRLCDETISAVRASRGHAMGPVGQGRPRRTSLSHPVYTKGRDC